MCKTTYVQTVTSVFLLTQGFSMQHVARCLLGCLLFGNCGVARVSLMVARQLLGCSGGYLVILGGSVLLWAYQGVVSVS